MTSASPSLDAYLARESSGLANACTACGKCVEVCPVVPHAGIDAGDAGKTVTGVLEFLRSGLPLDGDAAAWVAQCNGCGECIPACPEKINPRRMLTLAQTATTRRNGGVPRIFRKMARSVRLMAAMQLVPEDFARLFGYRVEREARVVFYLGCNALRTPHMLVNALYVLDRLEIDYAVVGGPASCCGIIHTRSEGEPETGGRITSNTLTRFDRFEPERVLSWCPSCQVHIGESLHGFRSTSFDFDHVTAFLLEHVDGLRERFVRRIGRRVILHAHAGLGRLGVNVAKLLEAIPGLTLVETVVESGYSCGVASAARAPELAAADRDRLLARVRDLEPDAVVSLYHTCHRSLVANMKEHDMRVVNFTDLLVEALGGTPHADRFQRYRLEDDWTLVREAGQIFLRANGMEVDPAWLDANLPDVFAMAEYAGGLECLSSGAAVREVAPPRRLPASADARGAP